MTSRIFMLHSSRGNLYAFRWLTPGEQLPAGDSFASDKIVVFSVKNKMSEEYIAENHLPGQRIGVLELEEFLALPTQLEFANSFHHIDTKTVKTVQHYFRELQHKS